MMASSTSDTIGKGDGTGDTLFLSAKSTDHLEGRVGCQGYVALLCKPHATQLLPVVRIILDKDEVVTFPLSRALLGSVWTHPSDLGRWEEWRTEKNWLRARDFLVAAIDYPVLFLTAVLQAFRSGRFQDGTIVTSRTWSPEALEDEGRLAVSFACSDCETVRDITVSSLRQTSHVRQKLTCSLFGLSGCSGEKGQRVLKRVVAMGGASGDESEELGRRRAGDAGSASGERGNEEREWELFGDSPVPRMGGRHITAHLTWGQMGNRGLSVVEEAVKEDSEVNASYFITGKLATSLKARDPTKAEVRESTEILKTAAWRGMVTGLLKWTARRNEGEFDGKGGVRQFNDWRETLEKFFDNWPVENIVIQARLAMVTLKNRAHKWWLAHRRDRPQLVVTFDQFVEWVRIELVPSALRSSSHLAWKRLRFQGDVEAYLQEVEFLMTQHPIDPIVSHVLACEPLGEELVYRIQGLDSEHAPAGISMEQLRVQIRSFAGAKGLVNAPLKKEERLSARSVESVATADRGRVERYRHDQGRTHTRQCWVCGDEAHLWPECPRRWKRGCPVCGSHAHRVYQCAQRRGFKHYAQNTATRKDEITTKSREAGEVATSAARTVRVEVAGEKTEQPSAAAEQVNHGSAHAFAVWGRSGEAMLRDVIEVLPEVKGVEPASNPEESGRLEYPIWIEDRKPLHC